MMFLSLLLANSFLGQINQNDGMDHSKSTKKVNHVCYLVYQTENNAIFQGQNILMYSLHTSIASANSLLSINITCVEILNHSHQGIPAELKDTSEQEEF